MLADLKGDRTSERARGTKASKVSCPAPVHLNALSILSDGNLEPRGETDDQIGAPSAVAVLEGWAIDWYEQFSNQRGGRLAGSVYTRIGRAIDFLSRNDEYAQEHHPAYPDYVTEINQLARQIYGTIGIR